MKLASTSTANPQTVLIINFEENQNQEYICESEIIRSKLNLQF